jgi:hypothetical protein
MSLRTTLTALVPSPTHIANSAALGRAPSTLITLAIETAGELITLLQILKADMQTGDGNISTINTQISNLS